MSAPLATLPAWLDLVLVGVVVALALGAIARRVWRQARGTSGTGCACPSAGDCGATGPRGDDLSAAARRAVERLSPRP